MERQRLAILLAVASLAVAGCVAPGASQVQDAAAGFVPCADPYPCGDEWPAGLAAPFELAEVVPLELAGHDGIPIEAYLHAPKLPDGVKAPVLLMVTPYPGTCASNAGTCYPRGDDPHTSSRLDAELVAKQGYAVVIANVRGTGNSGGCFEMGGENEQKDMVALVEALAAAEWSNGRVGMLGHSYPSFTAWQAAVQAPPALKTIIVSGHMTDLYTSYHSPQGAAMADGGAFQAGYSATLGLVPPLGAPIGHATLGHAGLLPERLCPEAARIALEPQRDLLVDDRDASLWEPRRLIDRVPDAKAAVLIVSGFEDAASGFHAFQDDELWRVLQAPKRAIYGHWGHELPPPEEGLKGAPFGEDWYEDTLLPWLDFWLKGVGEEPRVGVVDYRDTADAWRTTSAWPPADARQEVLYLSGGALSPSAGGAPTSVRLAPVSGATGLVCGETARMFEVEASEDVVLAGNPYAYVRLTSDRPGGVVALDLFELGPNFTCDGESGDYEWLATASADLRFHAGSYEGTDFPVGTPTMVRIDFHNQAWTIEKGNRLGIFVNAIGWNQRAGQPWSSTVTFETSEDAESSHVVLPIVNGTFGGAAPTLAYPPRPFAPITPAAP